MSLDVDLAGRRQRTYTKKFPALAADYVSLGYDSGGRLSLIDGGSWEYQYDHTEQRRTKLGVTSAEDTYFFYNVSGQLLTEDRADIGLDYVYLGGHLVAVLTQRSGSTNRAYIAGTDHLGAPLRLFNTTSGEIDWLADAEPFGAYWTHVPSTASDASLEFNVRGSNQYFDAETGLHANWYRYYDPNTGRYITEDPLLREIPGFEQPSAAFAMNNPGVYTDPDGRFSFPPPPPPPGPIVITPGGAIVYGGIVISAIVCAMIPACARFVFGIGPADEPNSCQDGPRKVTEEDREKCVGQYEDDFDKCKVLMTKNAKSRCFITAGDRLSWCNRTGQLDYPPLITHL